MEPWQLNNKGISNTWIWYSPRQDPKRQICRLVKAVLVTFRGCNSKNSVITHVYMYDVHSPFSWDNHPAGSKVNLSVYIRGDTYVAF